MYESVVEHNSGKSIIVAGSKEKKPLNSRYFIELHVAASRETSRVILDQMRRQQALEFIQIVGEWLKDHGFGEEVASLSVTAMGQVMIVCSNRVIDQIREQDVWAVAHIRSSDQFSKLARAGGRS
jgi:hypothetical protein